MYNYIVFLVKSLLDVSVKICFIVGEYGFIMYLNFDELWFI